MKLIVSALYAGLVQEAGDDLNSQKAHEDDQQQHHPESHGVRTSQRLTPTDHL